MSLLKNEDKCTGCGLCEKICPVGCIQMVRKEGGFLYPQIDSQNCIECDLCNKKCPVLRDKVFINPITSYAFKDVNENNRLKSASGGAASVFAKHVLQQGGAYTGVKFDCQFNAVHDICFDENELDMFRDSKYVQSDMKEIIDKISTALQEGKTVLATGTPCQIYALGTYFEDKHENLILCDLICHGVPSPLVFKTFISETEKIFQKKIKEFYFRDKTNGWRKSNVKIKFDDNTEMILERKDCDFFRLFGNNMIFRKSCHNCNFRNFNTLADITIGDYWGIEKKYPDFADESGCSVVIINTQKGMTFFEEIKNKAEILETDLSFAVETHPKLSISIDESIFRKAFFKMLKENGTGYTKALKVLFGKGFISKFERQIIKIIRK